MFVYKRDLRMNHVCFGAGNELENVMKNPSLNDLVGGICSVTLGDDEAKRRYVSLYLTNPIHTHFGFELDNLSV